MDITIGFLKLSAQRALLGNVTPNLRAVCLNYRDYVIEIIFFYDKGISENESELCEHVLDQILSDVPTTIDGVDLTFDIRKIQLDAPEEPVPIGHWVYFRYEP